MVEMVPCSAQNQRTKIFTKGQLRRRGKQKETSLVCENVIYKAKKKTKRNPLCDGGDYTKHIKCLKTIFWPKQNHVCECIWQNGTSY